MSDVILSTAEQDALAKQADLRDLVTNDYLKDKWNDNVKQIARIFYNDDLERTVELNVGSNAFMTVNDVYTFFVWDPKTDLDFKLSKFTSDLITLWKAVASISRVDNKLQLNYLPAKSHIYSNWENKTFRYYQAIVNDEKAYFVLKQTYRVWEVISELFQTQQLWSTSWTRVTLDTIPQTENLQEVQKTWFDRNSLFVVDDTQNIDDVNQSLIDKIKNLVYSLDRKQVMFETQFLQEVDQYKIFDNVVPSKEAHNLDWTYDVNRMGKSLFTDSTNWIWGDIKYVSNQNALITDAIKYEQTQLAKLSSTTLIPLDFLWLTTSGTTSWSSRQIMINSFIKSVEAKRDLLEQEFIRPILDLFIKEKQVNDLWEPLTDTIFWDEVISQDGKELAEELKIAREAGLISQFSSIKTYMWFNTEAEVESELEKMSLENNINDDDSQGNQGEQSETTSG